jgi:hypothetical protein
MYWNQKKVRCYNYPLRGKLKRFLTSNINFKEWKIMNEIWERSTM